MFDNLGPGTKIVLGIAAATAIKYTASWLMKENRKKRFERVGTVTELVCYPIKSCRGVYVKEAQCSKRGLKVDNVTDRHWVVIRPNGRFMSQRQNGKMAFIDVKIKDEDIEITGPDMPMLKVPIGRSGTPERIWIHDAQVEGIDCGDEAARWMSKYFGADGYRMMQYTDQCAARHFIDEAKPWETSTLSDDVTGFADWGSYLLLTESSLAELNKQLPRDVTMKNFRPNIIVGESFAFDEDCWEEIMIGDTVRMRCLDACTRCVMTTVDPEKGERSQDGEPLKTLKRIRTIPPYDKYNQCAFGINMTPDVCGSIKVGDPVYAIKKPRIIRTIPPYDKHNQCAFGINTTPDVCGSIKVGDPVYAIKKPRV